MKTELQEKLFNDFPQLYRDRFKPDTQSRMCDGFYCCGDGWFDLIYKLSSKIDEFCKKHNLTGNNYICAWQVKQKYGSLRFYTGNYYGNNYTDLVERSKEQNEELHKLIRDAENESSITCEVCGKSGKAYNSRGWISVSCEDHISKESFEIKD
jgi:hypothetical protein